MLGTDCVFRIMRRYVRLSIAFDNVQLIVAIRKRLSVTYVDASRRAHSVHALPNAREARTAGRGLRPLVGRRSGPTRGGTAPRSGAVPLAEHTSVHRDRCGKWTRGPEGARAVPARARRRVDPGRAASPFRRGCPARAPAARAPRLTSPSCLKGRSRDSPRTTFRRSTPTAAHATRPAFPTPASRRTARGASP